MVSAAFLHIAARELVRKAWKRPFEAAVRRLGELEIVEHGDRLSDADVAARVRQCRVLVTSWGSRRVPVELAADPGRLEYICHLTGGMRDHIPLALVESAIPVTNWGDSPARAVAEGAVTLLLAALKGLRPRIEHIAAGGWQPPADLRSGMLFGLDLGVYGCGYIGRAFIDMVRPFQPRLRVFDPFAADLPEGCQRVDSLEALFGASRAVAIHAGWTPQTEGSVTAALLALLPDGGIVINTGRGAIVDQEALFAELERGRLVAGLDVLVPPEQLRPDHPARRWPNAVLTAHCISVASPEDVDTEAGMEPMHCVCLDNLRRHLAGEPLRFRMDRRRYELST